MNCFKMCIFALARTTLSLQEPLSLCCELLQNVYLCISTYNRRRYQYRHARVVNCFKMCIFALARTTPGMTRWQVLGCELLQNVYLCISTYNGGSEVIDTSTVVNCFKMCIFALARTTSRAKTSTRAKL